MNPHLKKLVNANTVMIFRRNKYIVSLVILRKGPYVYCLLFIVLFAKNCASQIKSNYLNSHGEEAQEKPPGL